MADLSKFEPAALEPGKRYRLRVGEGDLDYIDVHVRPDGTGFTVRTGDGAPTVTPSAGNQFEVRRAFFEGDPRRAG